MAQRPPNEITIEYQDAHGNITRRTITVNDITDLGNGAQLEAYCHNAKAPRTFKIDRILWIITEDGEAMRLNEFLDIDRPEQGLNNFKWRKFWLVIWTVCTVGIAYYLSTDPNMGILGGVVMAGVLWIIPVLPVWLFLKLLDWLGSKSNQLEERQRGQ